MCPGGLDGIESVLFQLFAKYPQLNPSRVYAEGLSAGSITATALGIKKSHVFTAVGGHSGGIVIETGQLYKGNVPMIKLVAVMDYGHWNFQPTARIMWDFFSHYRRDPETKKLVYIP